jgi:hypothetical protein
MKVTIDRARWITGKLATLTERGPCYCALGFVAMACGVKPDSLLEVRSFGELEDPLRIPDRILDIEDVISEINDDHEIHRNQIEQRLIEEFDGLGIDIEFVGEAWDLAPGRL